MRAPQVAAACAALVLAGSLTACGGSATVDNKGGAESTSIAPLERASTAPSSAAASDAASATDSATASTASTAGSGAGGTAAVSPAVAGHDEAGREISAIPVPAGPAEQDAPYLEQVQASGINIDGVEDQLLGAASAACNSADTVTVNAVAGQLIEQGRTTLPIEQVAAILADNARATYCQ